VPTKHSRLLPAVSQAQGELGDPAKEWQGPGAVLLDRVGIPPSLVWGFLGLLLFLTGDGVESGYLAPFLSNNLHFAERAVGAVFTFYGLMAAAAGWFSGALSDVWGPRRVISIGFVIWIVFEIPFLVFGIEHRSYLIILLSYGLRGLGYPLFAYGFLVWITVVAPRQRLASAMGWFWFAFTGGLPTLGSLFARFWIPRIGPYDTLWASTGLVVLGGVCLLLGVREPRGRSRLVRDNDKPVGALIGSLKLAVQKPKTLVACIVRAINTAPEFGFFIILPAYFEKTIGFPQQQFLTLLSGMFLSNIIWNLLFGMIADFLGWRRTIAYCGGFGCAATTLALYYVPMATHSFALSLAVGAAYGATLAGYVPLSATAPMLEPEHRGEALSLLSLGASAAMLLGPAIVTLFLGAVGVKGVMWIFAMLYIASGVMALMWLQVPETISAAAEPVR
jgi:polyol permease family